MNDIVLASSSSRNVASVPSSVMTYAPLASSSTSTDEDWLADPAFGHWICDDFLPWIQDGKQRDVPSLYTAFDIGRGSVLDMLKDWDAAHLYGLYARASAMVHGSTIEHFT